MFSSFVFTEAVKLFPTHNDYDKIFSHSTMNMFKWFINGFYWILVKIYWETSNDYETSNGYRSKETKRTVFLVVFESVVFNERNLKCCMHFMRMFWVITRIAREWSECKLWFLQSCQNNQNHKQKLFTLIKIVRQKKTIRLEHVFNGCCQFANVFRFFYTKHEAKKMYENSFMSQ